MSWRWWGCVRLVSDNAIWLAVALGPRGCVCVGWRVGLMVLFLEADGDGMARGNIFENGILRCDKGSLRFKASPLELAARYNVGGILSCPHRIPSAVKMFEFRLG